MTETKSNGLAAALLILTPPLAALAAWGVPRLLTLGEHPAAWLAGIAAAAVAITAGAAAVDDGRREDAARTIWPLLLAWPLAYPWMMNRRGRLGSGLAGTLLLCGALAWSGWTIHQGHEAAAFLLQAASTGSGQASGEQNSTPTSGEQISGHPSGEAMEAERQRILQQRIDAILDAE